MPPTSSNETARPTNPVLPGAGSRFLSPQQQDQLNAQALAQSEATLHSAYLEYVRAQAAHEALVKAVVGGREGEEGLLLIRRD